MTTQFATRLLPPVVTNQPALVGPVAPTLPSGPSVRRRAERAVLQQALGRLRDVRLVEDSSSPLARPGRLTDLERHVITVRDERAWSAVARDGSAGLGEAYFRGWWHTDDLVGLLRMFVRNVGVLDRWRARAHALARPVADPIRRVRRADATRDRRNVRAHYDLSNDFFSSFLDETMTYSSAVFTSPQMGLADASREKLDRLCRKLGIAEHHRTLEIGTGWGSFAMHAAATRRTHVTTTTVSAAQATLARQRIADAGLSANIELLETDYRQLTGTFDRLASIEMIEAVDWRDVPGYFATCTRLLEPDGLMGMQAIVIADQRYERAKSTDDFIKRWVFPGGCLPSVSSLTRAATHAGDLRLIDLEDFGAHYAETLHRWRAQLHQRWDTLPSLGVTEELGRLWDFYLAYCEAAFLERHVSVVQLVLARSQWRPDGLTLRPC